MMAGRPQTFTSRLLFDFKQRYFTEDADPFNCNDHALTANTILPRLWGFPANIS
jgi:hypothetical protein